MSRERGSARSLAVDAPGIPVAVAHQLPPIDEGRYSVTWVGHASFVVRLGGLTILTDPVWSRRIPAVAPRLTPPGLPWTALPPVDAVVISHNHYDHLDAPTIRRLPRHTRVLVPAGLGSWFRRRGFTAVRELDWWQSCQVGERHLRFRPRPPLEPPRAVRHLPLPVGRLGGHGRRRRPDLLRRRHRLRPLLRRIGHRYPRHRRGAAARRRVRAALVHASPCTPTRRRRCAPARRSAPGAWPRCTGAPSCSPASRCWSRWSGPPRRGPTAGRPRDDLWDLAVGETRVG